MSHTLRKLNLRLSKVNKKKLQREIDTLKKENYEVRIHIEKNM